MLPGYPTPGWATTQVYPAREALGTLHASIKERADGLSREPQLPASFPRHGCNPPRSLADACPTHWRAPGKNLGTCSTTVIVLKGIGFAIDS